MLRAYGLGLAGPMVATAVLTATLVSCRATPLPSGPVRLVDRIGEATITGSPAAQAPIEHGARWSFGTDLAGWSAAQGVEGLRVEGGSLAGRTNSIQPALVTALPADLPKDQVWTVEVRARVSAGANLTVRFDSGPVLVLPRALGNPMGIFNTPLQAGDEVHTYSIRPGNPVTTGDGPGHLLISPSDQPGADFAIESVRVVLRGEYLHSVPSGVSWQGLSEIYRETIVSRAPEVVSFDVQLPAHPFLDLEVGALEAGGAPEAGALSFQVAVEAHNGESRIWSQTINEAGVWHSGVLDLAELEGRQARVSLSLASANAGAIGLWGAPAIRSGATAAATGDSSPPNGVPTGVIVILADTLRSDHLDAWGYGRETAPTLSRLAREGVRFLDCISQSTWTKVSVPAIQTSLYPTTHTIKDLPDRLPASADTLAETFRQAGYSTLALTSIPFVGRMTNLHQGYEALHETGSLPGGGGNPGAGGTSKSANTYVERLISWIDRRNGSPFFALLHVADPHSPYRPRKEHELLFAAEGEMDRLDQLTQQVRPQIEHPLMKIFGMPTRSELARAKIDPEEFVRIEHNGYDGSIKGMDEAIAKLLAHLETKGLAGRVLVVLISDHGTEFLEHDGHFHGHTAFGELNRVPLIFWGPGVPAGVEVATTVQTIDMMPTLLELSGLSVPDKAQGQSLRPFFTNPDTPWRRPAITELPFNLRGLAASSIIVDGWKLVRIGPLDAEPEYRLYDHRQDPLNLLDLAADNQKIVARLAQTLDNWHAGAQAARLDDSASTATLDADELERLRSLGYVQ